MFGLTDRGNKITVNSVWVMFWYDRTYIVGIGKTTEKLKLWLTNPNTGTSTGLVNQGQL